MEGVNVLTGLDVYAEVGFAAALLKHIPNVQVNDGQLTIDFIAPMGGEAEVNGIQVLPAINVILPGQVELVRDLDGDGKAEDLNGNGRIDFADVVALFEHLDSPEVQDNQQYFDFDGNGTVNTADVVMLFDMNLL